MQLFIIIALCVFNLVAWAVMFYKFKKLFNTDDIIAETKNNCDEILKDLIRNVDKNITLLDARTETIATLIKDADKRIKILMDLEKSNTGVSSLKSILAQKPKKSASPLSDLKKDKAVAAYESAIVKKTFVRDVSQDTIVEIKGNKKDEQLNLTNQTESTNAKINKTDLKTNSLDSATNFINKDTDDEDYGDDFSKMGLENPIQNSDALDVDKQDPYVMGEDANDNTQKESTFEYDTNDAGKEEGNIIIDNVFNNSRDDKKDRVLKLFDSGFDVDDIAQKLSCSTTEVQFILDIAGRV